MLSIGNRTTYSTLEEILDPRHSAVLVIDQQKDFTDPDGYYARGLKRDTTPLRALTEPINALTAAARKCGVPVIFTQFVIGEGFRSDSSLWLAMHAAAGLKSLDQQFYTMENTPGAAFADGLVVEQGDTVVRKYRASAFHGTSLDVQLRARGVTTLVITGQVGEGCVETTVRQARDMDYWTVLVPDAIGTLQPDLYDGILSNWKRRTHCPTVKEILAVWSAQGG
jgi:nicotinamidase-related amidase